MQRPHIDSEALERSSEGRACSPCGRPQRASWCMFETRDSSFVLSERTNITQTGHRHGKSVSCGSVITYNDSDHVETNHVSAHDASSASEDPMDLCTDGASTAVFDNVSSHESESNDVGPLSIVFMGWNIHSRFFDMGSEELTKQSPIAICYMCEEFARDSPRAYASEIIDETPRPVPVEYGMEEEWPRATPVEYNAIPCEFELLPCADVAEEVDVPLNRSTKKRSFWARLFGCGRWRIN